MTEDNQMNKETRPPTIAIVGRPNVGKSSLFNAIVGRRVSIVHEMPGVTRDRVIAPLARGKRRFRLIDTGGLGMIPGETRKVDAWDGRIAEQVKVAVEEADVLILVVNTQDGVVSLDEEVARHLRSAGKTVLVAANKCDNPSLAGQSVEFAKLGFNGLFPVSCLHRSGIDPLVDAALKLLPENIDAEAEAEGTARKFNIAVVGRPNVGKSSLVNALLGEERVMVSDVAGTTRDAIDVDFELKFRGATHPATLVDTAGLRKTAKVDTVVEYFSVMRAKAAIDRADLVLFLVEASPDGVTAQDRRIASMVQESGKGCVIVANKFDVYKSSHKVKQLEEEVRYSLSGMNYAPLVFISARDRWNLDGLLDRIAEVMEQLEMKIPTGVLNRVLMDAFVAHTPPVVGSAPLKLFYASMVGMTPPRIRLFVNNPANCADNYLAFLTRTVRNAFDLSGLPVELELRARPKKVVSIRSEPGAPRRRGNMKADPEANAASAREASPTAEKPAPEKKKRKPTAGKIVQDRKKRPAGGRSQGRKPAPKRDASKRKGGK